jgi:NAD(P)-dependent dehydrogenase (short-subunit alcohol dehydrogenase family)
MAQWLITGGNRGIGLALTRQLRERGETVIVTCREGSDELAATGAEVVEGIDVTSDDDAERLAGTIGGRRLDVLLHCAGILERDSLEELDLERIRRQIEVNALAPLRITRALLHRLGEGSTIAIVTSRMGSIADNDSGGYYGYRMSKAAVNMAGRNLARDLRDRGITVLLLHPGMVSTRMTGNRGISPEEAAAGLIARIDGLGLEDSGTFWHANGEALPW